MNRRSLLKGVGAAGVTTIAGCIALGAIVEETDLLDAPEADETSPDDTGDDTADDSEPEPEPSGSTEVVYDDMAIGTEDTVNFEATAGDVVTIDAENVHGQTAVIQVWSYEAGTKYLEGHDEQVIYTSAEHEIELVDEDDVYGFRLIPDERARATVEVTRYD